MFPFFKHPVEPYTVCGEPCAIQKCVACMNEAKTAIVDFSMQRAISDIDPTSKDKLIALECGHIFTVKTLDAHCSMSEYYEIDLMTDRYFKMKAPPIKYQTPPTCPTCRGPITSPRYGRVTKRANLDILEQNVASNMSKRLEKHGPDLEAIAASLEASETAAKAIARREDFVSEVDFTRICEKRKELHRKPDEPLSIRFLRELKVLHGFPKKEGEDWKDIVKDINQVYNVIAEVASARSAHVKAHEAAITTLFKLEMETLDPSKLDGKTQYEAAFEAVNAKVGQPPHKADRKYQIEAFLLTIELRLMLAQIASARVSGLPLTSSKPDHSRHRQIWTTFVSFLYDSCIEDCAKANSLARSCSAFRQEARVSLVELRCTFEKFRFEVLEEHRQIQISNKGEEDQTRMRTRLGTLISQQESATRKSYSQVWTRHFQNRVFNSQHETNEIHWFKDNCTSRAEKVIIAYKDLHEQVLKEEVFYQSIMLREKQDIVKAFGFGMCSFRSFIPHHSRNRTGHVGHFYNCPKGHTFVITEVSYSHPYIRILIDMLLQCGGAMEASTCPECGSPIGGGSHRLLDSNTRAIEFEQLEREGGATENPWAPGGYLANAF